MAIARAIWATSTLGTVTFRTRTTTYSLTHRQAIDFIAKLEDLTGWHGLKFLTELLFNIDIFDKLGTIKALKLS